MMMDCEEKKEKKKGKKKEKEREHRKVAMKINIIPKRFRRLLNFEEGLDFARHYISAYPNKDFDRLVPVTKDDFAQIYVENRFPKLFKESERVSYEKIALDIEEFLHTFEEHAGEIIEKRLEKISWIKNLDLELNPNTLLKKDYEFIIARKICDSLGKDLLKSDILEFVTNSVKNYLKQKVSSWSSWYLRYSNVRSLAESLIEHLPKSYKSAMGISEEDSLALQ